VLSDRHGGIVDLRDRGAGVSVSRGSRNGCLWGASQSLPGPRDYSGGCLFTASGADRFSYSWNREAAELTLRYTPANTTLAAAVVTISIAGPSYFDMRLELVNRSSTPIVRVLFPSDLILADAEVDWAYLPSLLPGVRLRPSFFLTNRSFTATYPGARAFADFLAWDASRGHAAFYSVNTSTRLVPAMIGFQDDEERVRGASYVVHTYQTAIPPGGAWTSPAVRVRVGSPVNDSILAYRNDNGIARFPRIEEKLGPLFDYLLRAPLVKADFHVEVRKPFRAAIADMDFLSPPALIHPVAFQPRGHDEFYPDFLPPDARWGDTTDFRAFAEAARGRGHFVMPYTNPTAWSPDSPTVWRLPGGMSLREIAVRDPANEPVFEYYGANTLFPVSPFHPFVQSRLRAMMRQWTTDVPVSFVFLDQIGSRNWLIDRNSASPDPTSYSQGWLNFWREHRAQYLMTEDGWDRLAEDGIGFCGTALTGTSSFNQARQRYGEDGNGHVAFGAGHWDPYPILPLLAHDKVLFYQHDLEGHLSSESLEVMTWNAAFGNMVSHLWPAGNEGRARPSHIEWGTLLQRSIAVKYGGVKLDEFAYVSPDVTRSRFGSLTVLANWSERTPYPFELYRITPGGFAAWDAAGTVLAGNFTTARGDHWVLIERDGDAISVRQPVGPDWDAAIRLPNDWPAQAELQVAALDAAGRRISVATVRAEAGVVRFLWRRVLGLATAQRYVITLSR